MENQWQLIHRGILTHRQELLAILDLFHDQHLIQVRQVILITLVDNQAIIHTEVTP